ncbi:MAG TPA: tRNA (adenosine(37)-N6)-threonylcarbamoyltransferase complex ATPase subunit type 1 TsaE [Bacteroidales bacterium]|jgi:tRNA threonylcarbamoyladenosine biosynthesis protein TsaE|nr:tRNA (adenosine(37)-N6)-threonylcarbamoyltransferase complex ATPase subunit type 1 TsaE [Bacteroidales bacterium]HPY81360.1 tRNA (adenosine(37)-N6)-threonylcarbamoyltransferase complex ATPase subunit type 1 TsaE [Bacteroidales bacterium]HQA86855.1 tRNA (adenosine(37)-N6)-threonylcarbamoyltransferase complex ATPase subunit type 1 TsaE [Bacteroidales bacterium]HRR03972.1 tRNA (adenosine(37)-N6)-threonylcarbamoyltransferase complex ATPase subunit type 1 TsaE [Bacteroidales bacterium]HXK74477.1 
MFKPIKFIAKNEEELTQVAKDLLRSYPDYRIFAFYGDMGTGKTTFIKELCRQLGVKNLTSSPSFAIINEYWSENDEPIYHFDFYRINDKVEVFDIGFSDYLFSGNYCFIEWSEKIEEFLTSDHLHISIEVDDNFYRIFAIKEMKIE